MFKFETFEAWKRAVEFAVRHPSKWTTLAENQWVHTGRKLTPTEMLPWKSNRNVEKQRIPFGGLKRNWSDGRIVRGQVVSCFSDHLTN